MAKKRMNWYILDDIGQLDPILKRSHTRPQLLFKHSVTCPISMMARMRIEDHWDLEDVDAHYLDLLQYRAFSNHIAERLEVHHESPQVILLVGGEAVYDASHMDITVNEIKSALEYTRKQSSNG